MKKILFLLVALLGVVGMANAAAGDVVQYDRSLLTLKANDLSFGPSTTQVVKIWNKSNPDAVVSYNAGTAKLMSGTTVISGYSVAVNQPDPLKNEFTFTITQTDPTATLPSTYLLTLPEKFFVSPNGEYSQVITFKLDWLDWNFTPRTDDTPAILYPHIKIFQFVGDETHTFTATVNGAEATLKASAATLGGLKLDKNGNKLVLNETKFNAETPAGVQNIVLAAGTFEDASGVKSPVFNIYYEVIPPVYSIVPHSNPTAPSVAPAVITSIENDAVALTMRFAVYGTTYTYEDLESSWVEKIKIGNQVITTSDANWTVKKKEGIVIYTITGINPETIFPNGAAFIDVPVVAYGPFGANQNQAFAYGVIRVNQKVVANKFILGFKDWTHDYTEALDVTKCELPAAAGGFKTVLGKVYNYTPGEIYLTQNESGTPVKIVATSFSNTQVSFVNSTPGAPKLKSGNTNIVVANAGAVYAYGNDYIKYTSKATEDYVDVYHALAIEDRTQTVGPKHVDYKTMNTIVNPAATIYDNYQCVSYNRNYKGVKEALYVPFSFKAGDFPGTIQKIYAVTQDEDVVTFHIKTLKPTDLVLANKPYIVTADGNVKLELDNHGTMDLINVLPATADYVTCSTTEVNYDFFGTVLDTYFTSSKPGSLVGAPAGWTGATVDTYLNSPIGEPYSYHAMQDGQLKTVVASNTVAALRFYMRSTQNPHGVDYSKVVFVEDDETTGINSVATEAENGEMFNVAGQRISAPVKGQVYIMNGKKYIAK